MPILLLVGEPESDQPAPGIIIQIDEQDLVTQGSGTYVFFENTRAVMADKNLELETFSPPPRSGNLIWIEHMSSVVEPGVLDGWGTRKIVIQLPALISEGEELNLRVPGVDPKSLAYQSPNSTQMLDGMIDVEVFNAPGDSYWVSEETHREVAILKGKNSTSKPVKLGSVKILKMTPTTVTIGLDLPTDITMRPSGGEIPRNITLTRKNRITK